MNKNLPLIIIVLIVFVIIVIFTFITGKVNTHVSINGVDINEGDVSVYETKYRTSSTCTSINTKATIDCNCNIVVGNKQHEYKNTINAVSCDNSSDLCSGLCKMFVEDLKNK